MIGWLAQLAQVALVCLPVVTALLGLAAVGGTLIGAVVGIQGINIAVSNYVGTWLYGLADFITITKNSGSNFHWLVIILDAIDLGTLLRLLLTFAHILMNMFLGFAGIGTAVTVAAAGVWLYKKAKLLANILAGQGAMD